MNDGGSVQTSVEKNSGFPPARLIWLVVAGASLLLLLASVGLHSGAVQTDGGMVHGLLEWSTVCVSLFTAVLGLLYLSVRADDLILTLSIAAFASGLWDALHSAGSLGLLEVSGDMTSFVPLTWAISRTMSAALLGLGSWWILKGRGDPLRPNRRWYVATVLLLVGLAYMFVELALLDPLPVALFPDSVVKRPWDVPALVLYLVNALVLFPALVRSRANIISRGLLLSTVPAILSESLMTFGSAHLYDGAFHTAHAFKLITASVPLVAIGLYFVQSFRRETRVASRLEEAVQELRTVEAELRVNEVRFTQLTESIREVFWISAADGSEMYYVSPAYEEIFGLSRQRLYENPGSFLEVVHPDDAGLMTSLLENVLRAEFQVEYRIRRGNDRCPSMIRTPG